ncbi:hypothetical protein K3495_g647 [Podosphaera aphanis]|nr:hypothetical protein K3495_g647 [Podosphaera aphanis]
MSPQPAEAKGFSKAMDTHTEDIHASGYADSGSTFKQMQAAGISITPEMYEKMFTPRNTTREDLRKTFGNPTPVALMGFLICLSPLSCDLMGWRGAGGNGAAGIGSYYFFGGLLMILGAFLEFILGKTFTFVVFSSFGGFWLTLASTLQPFYNASSAYAPPNAVSSQQGFATVGFTASFGFFQMFMAVLCLIYLICSLRTNICFVVIFLTLTIAYSLLAACYWELSEAIAGDLPKVQLGHRLQIAAGACLFITSLTGWYVFFALMLVSIDFPLQLPVGNLSTYIKGRSQRIKENTNMA